jgi:hypothetical protein
MPACWKFSGARCRPKYWALILATPRTWHWAAETPLDSARLRATLDALPAGVLRAKGILRIGADAVPHLLQLVGRSWTLTPWTGLAPDLGLTLIGTPDVPASADLAALFARATSGAP